MMINNDIEKEKKKFEKALDSLKSKIIKHSSISVQFRTYFIEVLKKEQENIKVVSNKFKLNVKFLKSFIEFFENKVNIKTDAENGKYDKILYREFKRLKKFELIHKDSVSYLPRNLVLVSINPNHNSLLTQSYSKLDKLDKAIMKYKNYCSLCDNNFKILQYIFFYLRIFHIIPFTKSVLKRINWRDIIFTPTDMAALIIYEDRFLKFTSKKETPKSYKIILLDKFVSKLLKKVYLTINNKNQLIFENINQYENNIKKIKNNSSIKDIKINEVRNLVKIRYMYLNSPLTLTLRTGIVVPVQLSLSDIETLFPNTVSKELMEYENIRVKSAITKPVTDDKDDDIDWEKITFDISELEDLIALLKHKDNEPSKELIKNTLFELNQALKFNQPKNRKSEKIKYNHLTMIYEYLSYVVDLVDKKKIRLSTAKNYIWLLNKHLFRMIEDFFDIKEYEVIRISNRLDKREYKDSSIKRIKSQINRFFRYFSKKGINIDINGAFYPKSLVLIDEVDKILNNLEKNYKEWKNIQKIGKQHKLFLMQLKVIVLLGFYCGLRLKEVSSLLLPDLYIYGNKIHIDINSKGIKKTGFKLKTTNSKRRIDVTIENLEHLKVISEFLEMRSKLNKNSKFIFLELSKYNGFLNKSINIENFDYINEIIEYTTKRYCTFHSLRHSFATYQCQHFIPNGSSYPYELLELSNKMGHQTPDTTIQSYIHAGILFLTNNNEI